ncbi:24239_t:CDS:2, partial [Gigaspora margarita]
HILRVAKLQKEDLVAIITSTPPLEFSLDNPYINRDKPENLVNKSPSTDMDTSDNHESVSMDLKTQNSKKDSSIGLTNKPIINTSELKIYQTYAKLFFTNTSHDETKIGIIKGYRKVVKKYLQVGQQYRVSEILFK